MTAARIVPMSQVREGDVILHDHAMRTVDWISPCETPNGMTVTAFRLVDDHNVNWCAPTSLAAVAASPDKPEES